MNPRPETQRHGFSIRSRFKWVLLGAVQGALVATFVLFLILAAGEDRLFEELVAHSTAPEMTSQERSVALLHEVHDLLQPRRAVFRAGDEWLGLRERYLRSAGFELNAPRGVCGSFSTVLCRALQVAAINTRLVQMKVGEVWGAHTVVEAEVRPGHWVVFDPVYDQYFVRPDGELASADDVHRDWAAYRDQTAPAYDARFCYADLRYTNWGKVPVVLPALRWLIAAAGGEEYARTVSLRPYFLNLFRAYAWIAGSLALLLPLTVFAFWGRRRRIAAARGASPDRAPAGTWRLGTS